MENIVIFITVLITGVSDTVYYRIIPEQFLLSRPPSPAQARLSGVKQRQCKQSLSSLARSCLSSARRYHQDGRPRHPDRLTEYDESVSDWGPQFYIYQVVTS